jgi:hypothetical protein
MADHVRRQIRDAAVALLTGLNTTGNRVFATRVRPLQDAELPALCVYASGEVSEIDSMGNSAGARGLSRELILRVEAHVRSFESLDDSADDIALEVETTLAADKTLGGLVKDLQLRSTEIGFAEGDRLVAGMRMAWRARYRTRETTPGAAI